MEALVTKQFRAVPDGKVYPELYNPGDTVTGSVAKAAIDEGWATEKSKAAVAAEAKPAPAAAPAPEPVAPVVAAPVSEPANDTAPVAPVVASPNAGRRAKTKAAVEIPDGSKFAIPDGSKIAKGAIVEGELAAQLVAENKAIWLADKGAAPETK